MSLPRASFRAASGGFRFVLTYEPQGPVRGVVIHAPPFAEEMNRSRRMTALAARALMRNGWRVVVTDLAGCGESSSDHGEATWDRWVDDLRASVIPHLRAGPLWLWGVRAGALLACALIDDVVRAAGHVGLLLWQPVVDGSQQLNQFLRLKTVGALTGGESIDRKTLLAQLACGETLEVAGYRLAPALADGLAMARVTLPAAYRGPVVWLSIETQTGSDVPPYAAGRIEEWRAAGVAVEFEAVAGLPFWQTQEITECAALVERTVARLDQTAVANRGKP